MVAVIALVHDPRCTWSVTRIGSGEPILRIPSAPIAASRLPVTIAPIKPGRWCSSRTGASNWLTRSSAYDRCRGESRLPSSRDPWSGQTPAGPDCQPLRRHRKRNIATPDHDLFARSYPGSTPTTISDWPSTRPKRCLEVWRRDTPNTSLVDREARRNLEPIRACLVRRLARGRFMLEQPFLAVEPAAVSPQRSIGGDDAMAGNHDGNGVPPICRSDRSRRPRPANPAGQARRSSRFLRKESLATPPRPGAEMACRPSAVAARNRAAYPRNRHLTARGPLETPNHPAANPLPAAARASPCAGTW